MSNKYDFPYDGRSKPHTLANEHRSIMEVLERLSVLTMRDKDEFELHEDDWKNIIRAGVIISPELIYYGLGYVLDGEGSSKTWARRVKMGDFYKKVISQKKEREKKEIFQNVLEKIASSELLNEKEQFVAKGITNSYTERNPSQPNLFSNSKDLAETFKNLYDQRPDDADLNMQWQKKILDVARKENTPVAWIFSAEIIARSVQKRYHYDFNSDKYRLEEF